MNDMTEIAAHAVIKRSAMHIAAAMISGGYEERERAWDAAVEIEEEVTGFIELAKRSITMLGHSAMDKWVQPAPDSDVPDAEILSEQEAKRLDGIGAAVGRHISGAYVSGSNHQHARAAELERDLTRIGLDLSISVNRMVLEQMRLTPADRGEHGRPDICPF